ncbi:MAG: hypothetical protein ACFBWO_17715 [Paracoccaceae bacterium]
MKPLALAISLALAATLAPAQVVQDKASCQQAVADAKEGRDAASVSESVRAEVDDLVRIAEHLCGEANFVYAERLLAIARGMTAEE